VLAPQALTTTPLPNVLAPVLNFTGSWADIIGASHVDPVPQNLLNFLLENPIGPQLDAAVKNLPVLTVSPLGAHVSGLFHRCHSFVIMQAVKLLLSTNTGTSACGCVTHVQPLSRCDIGLFIVG
jgi:hypothetical protein